MSKKVLVVDDERSILQLLKDFAGLEGKKIYFQPVAIGYERFMEEGVDLGMLLSKDQGMIGIGRRAFESVCQ